LRTLTSDETEGARARLLAAGKELIARFGLAKTTVREICAAAGVASGSFYLYYPSKDEIFSEILVAEVATGRARNRAALSSAAELGSPGAKGATAPEELIRGFLSRLIADLEANPILAIFYRRDSREAAKRALVSARGGAAFASIAGGLEEVVAEWARAGLVPGDIGRIRGVIQALIHLALDFSDYQGGEGRDVVQSYIGFVAAGIASKPLGCWRAISCSSRASSSSPLPSSRGSPSSPTWP
jgi:AcrR family transcriptional regulator